MSKEFLLETLGIRDTRLIPEALMEVLFGDPANRHKFYRAMLEANDFAMDREWFQPIYEAELSERGQKKQDFTPAAASQLAAMITDNGARRQGILEPTAGNGSMIIAKWWELCRKRIVVRLLPERQSGRVLGTFGQIDTDTPFQLVGQGNGWGCLSRGCSGAAGYSALPADQQAE
jgi:hypothetical protein